MKKQTVWSLVFIVLGNLIRLFFIHQGIQLDHLFVWVLGTIWFILFLVYVLCPVGIKLLEDRED